MHALPLRALGLALAASLLAHGALLMRSRPAPERTPRAVTLASLPAPTQPLALPEPATTPPGAAPTPARAPTPDALPPAPTPPLLDAPPAPTPALRLAAPAAWRYRLRQGGQDGEALLAWQPQPDGRYSLRLSRQIGERALPAWESLGRLGSEGLVPERFAQQRGGQDRQAINFDTAGGRLSFSASTAQLDLPEGTQDRLSWWLQLAALVQATGAPQPGTRWRLWVAGLRGELREWTFELAEAEANDGGALHLRRLPLGPHDPGIELWLAPSRGHWPVRLRQGDPELRGYELWLLEAQGDVKS